MMAPPCCGLLCPTPARARCLIIPSRTSVLLLLLSLQLLLCRPHLSRAATIGPPSSGTVSSAAPPAGSATLDGQGTALTEGRPPAAPPAPPAIDGAPLEADPPAGNATPAAPPGGAAVPLASRCTAFNVHNRFCCYQAILVCENVCYEGKRLVYTAAPAAAAAADGIAPPPSSSTGGSGLCLAETAGAAQEARGFLRPVGCSDMAGSSDSGAAARAARQKQEFYYALTTATQETLGRQLEERPAGWLAARQAVSWRNGTTFVQGLGGAETNIAHFSGKIFSLLMLNNFSGPTSLVTPVTRIMLLREKGFTHGMLDTGGTDGWHATVLRHLAYAVLGPHLEAHVPLLELDAHPEFAFRLSEGARRKGAGQEAAAPPPPAPPPLGFGSVEYEGAMVEATEDRPLCWQRAVFPGILKAVMYPGGPDPARVFKQQLAEAFGVVAPPPEGYQGRVKMLYIARTGGNTGGRRLMTPASLKALAGLFKDLDFEITQAEFAGKTFREQFELVQSAEVIVSMHGAALVNPTMFAREGSVVLEIAPFMVYYDLYYFMAMSSGVTYMRHQNTPGLEDSKWRNKARARDAMWEKLNMQQCSSTPACKQYFTHHRRVELGLADVAALGRALALAKRFALLTRQGVPAAAAGLPALLEPLCLQNATLSHRCRQDFIGSPLVDAHKPCVLEQDCASLP